jgi:hypothetical protein
MWEGEINLIIAVYLASEFFHTHSPCGKGNKKAS